MSTDLLLMRVHSRISITQLSSCLEEIENKYESFIVQSKELQGHFWSIKIGSRFLMCFVEHSTKVQYVWRIQQLVDELIRVVQCFSNQCGEASVFSVSLDCLVSTLRDKMRSAVINPQTGRNEVIHLCEENRTVFSGINNLLLDSFGNLTAVQANCITNLLETILELKQKLKLLRPLFHYVSSRRPELSTNCTLIPQFRLLWRATVILYSCLVEKMDEVRLLSVKPELLDVVREIDVKHFYFTGLSAYTRKARSKYKFSVLAGAILYLEINKMPLQNPQIEELRKLLSSLEAWINVLQYETKGKNLRASVNKLIGMAFPILYLCNKDSKLEANYIKEADRALSQVCDQMRDIQAEFGVLKIHRNPKTHPIGFLEFFCSYMKELQEYRPQQIGTLNGEILTLYEEFNLSRSCLMLTKQPKKLNNLQEHIISLACDALYIIDLFLACESSTFMKSLVSRIINLVTPVRKEMEALSTGLLAIEEKGSISQQQVNTKRSYVAFTDEREKTTKSVVRLRNEGIQVTEEGDSGTSSTSSIPLQVSTFSEIGFVGFKDEVKKAVESLANDLYENRVISIVGMAGIGKTTLANKLYEDPIIRGHFDVRAWCTVSQAYRKSELWRSILHQVSGKDATGENDDEMIAEKIAQSLKRRRYLIVIDDMWDILAWKDLRRYLPNDSNGSRVLITTRYHSIAEETASPSSNICNLRLFREEESLELFDRKIGSKANYSADLLQIGHQIALRCQGLPLAISVIAGHVSKVDRNVERWKEIAESLTSCILRDSERPYRAMLEWSYNYLPNHLKPCFLYAGALGACRFIPVWKLKLLWIAEGLVQSNDGENLETRAEEYLVELISRSLVTPTHYKSIGGVKAFVMHDLLRDFCAEISEEESFMHMINMDSWLKLFSSDDQAKLCRRRLSIWSRGYKFLKERPSSTGFGVQSLVCSRGELTFDYYAIDVSFICFNFKLLRVLNIDEMDVGNSIDRIGLLIHLRYLAVCASLRPAISIPSSIFRLWNLQSLIVKLPLSICDPGHVMDIPDSLWDMLNLRNVHIDCFAGFQVENSRGENSPFPENIETLSRPCFSSTEDAKKLLGRLRKLRKLSCIFLNCWDDSTCCYQFPVLDFLTQLVSLKITGEDLCWKSGALHEFSFPSDLKKLTLRGFKMMGWDEMSNISKKLPNLEVLKLESFGCDGTWDVGEEDFPNLKYLKLTELRFKWFASEESFPKLEQLHLVYCFWLEEIPLCFDEAPCLQIITLDMCHTKLRYSALRIERMQKEVALNSEFRVDLR